MSQSQIFAAFGKAVGNNKGSVQNFGIVGFTITFEQLTKFIFFYCPCDYPDNKFYGAVFIWGPAAVLLIVGYLANRRTWRLTTGLCNRTQGIGKGGKRIVHFIYIFLQIGMKAMLAPLTWVVLAFLKGDYYACSRWPDPIKHTARSRAHFGLDTTKNTSLPLPCIFNPNPAKFSAKSEAEIIARNLRAESHVIGWIYLSLGLAVGVIVMFAFRCKSKYSYEQSNYIARYRQSEINQFEEMLDKKSAEQAKRIVEGYFAKPRSKEEWDQIAVINDKVTRSKRGRAIYSPLHKFVNRELRAADEAENKPPEYDIVSDAAMKKTSLKALAKKKSGDPPKPSNSGGNATSIPMVPIVSAGGTKTTVIQQQAPPVAKSDTVQPKPVAKPDNNVKPAPAGAESHTLPNVQVVDPSAKQVPVQPAAKNPESSPSTADNPPKPAERSPTVAKISVENHPPTTPATKPNPDPLPPALPPPPQPVRVPHPDPLPVQPEIQAAVKETSLGDFGGAVSRENLQNLSDDDSDDELSGGDDVIKTEAVQDGLSAQQEPSQMEEDVVRHSDEEPLLGED